MHIIIPTITKITAFKLLKKKKIDWYPMNLKKSGFSTRAIHACEKENEFGAVTTPIYQTAPFEFKSASHAAGVMSGKQKGYIYSRGLNPTTEVLEEKMAELEGL